MAVVLSEAAAKQVKELKQAQNLPETAFLRMGVRGGGCSGMSYVLEFDTEKSPHDKEFDIDGVKVVIDKKRSEEHTSELQSQSNLVCRLLLEKKKKIKM